MGGGGGSSGDVSVHAGMGGGPGHDTYVNMTHINSWACWLALVHYSGKHEHALEGLQPRPKRTAHGRKKAHCAKKITEERGSWLARSPGLQALAHVAIGTRLAQCGWATMGNRASTT